MERPLRITLVIPCFNEEQRLDPASLREAVERRPNLRLRLVDDGSTDGTSRVLEGLCAAADGALSFTRLARNQGKAEAVRQGMLSALPASDAVGFWDADLAAPLSELELLERPLDDPAIEVVLASRVALLGSTIRRRAFRHYVGRCFATAASLALRLPVYDTQCGAKLFRVTPQLARALATPFSSRWLVDVELLARLIEERGLEHVARTTVEVPLRLWTEVPGGKVRLREALAVVAQLAGIAARARLLGPRDPR